MLERYRLNGFR